MLAQYTASVDSAQLRVRLRELVVSLKDRVTHTTLAALCQQLGLPVAPTEVEGSKGDRIRASFDAVADADLLQVVDRVVAYRHLSSSDRNELQDLAWLGLGPQVPKRFRRELAESIEGLDLFLDARRFDELLDSLWVLETSMDLLLNHSLRDDIDRHVHHNPGDWSASILFDKVGAFDCCDRRFVLFVEGLASPEVLPDETAQRRFVEAVNVPLRKCHVELRETDHRDGYPVFSLVSTTTGPAGRPKNLIFASPLKPDLRFRDAVNNDIEIVTNADRVLVYDRPIGRDGLRWNDLQDWWAEWKGIVTPVEAKRSLFARLRESLPPNSPAQSRLFEGFYRAFGPDVPMLPALLPEVWLHWDPRTVKERGPDALARFRMDFLLLLPGGIRVVVEVDGKHHYADRNDRADPSLYAATVAADRDLRLCGYEVYRFGAAELVENAASQNLAKTFFTSLFKRYGVSTSRTRTTA